MLTSTCHKMPRPRPNYHKDYFEVMSFKILGHKLTQHVKLILQLTKYVLKNHFECKTVFVLADDYRRHKHIR